MIFKNVGKNYHSKSNSDIPQWQKKSISLNFQKLIVRDVGKKYSLYHYYRACKYYIITLLIINIIDCLLWSCKKIAYARFFIYRREVSV